MGIAPYVFPHCVRIVFFVFHADVIIIKGGIIVKTAGMEYFHSLLGPKKGAMPGKKCRGV
jgi:hypothetical protein